MSGTQHHIEDIGDMTHEQAADELQAQIEECKEFADKFNSGLTRMGALYRKWAEEDPADRMQHNAIDSARIDLGRVCRDLRDQPDLFVDSWPSRHHGTI